MRFLSIFVMLHLLIGCSQNKTQTNNQSDIVSQILPLKERARFIDDMTEKRVNQLLPELMQNADIDAWLLISREYNEDPVLKTMLPASWLSARRTTILLFILDQNKKVQAYAIAPYKVGNVFKKGWDKANQPNQWQALVDLLAQYQPEKIGINQSEIWAHADGIVKTDYQTLVSNIPTEYRAKLVSAEALAIPWLEQRIAAEVATYKQIVAIAHEIIAEGFSDKVITAGKTTTEDLMWWYRERVAELKMQVWFHPSVSIQRADNSQFDHETAFTNKGSGNVIQPGDLLHVDFGITYLRLNTDTQQHAYVLKSDESEAPEYLVSALRKGNQLQDILTAKFGQGKPGNQVLKEARETAIEQGLKPTIYTHPIGYHGHGAGTTIGMWDAQGGVAGDGDYPLHLNTAYSIELNNAQYIEAWGKEIRIMLEEEAFFDSSGVWYLNGRQTEFHLIPSS